MAAGKGQRMADIAESKPLTLVQGRALIDHVLGQFRDAGIKEVFVAVRADDHPLLEHVEAIGGFASGIHPLLLKAGGGTGTALHALAKAIGESPALISTADTIAPPGTYRRLLAQVETLPSSIACLILSTTYLQDPDPIWIQTDQAGRILALAKGIEPTGLLFANVRWLAPRCCKKIADMPVERGARDTVLMRTLIEDGRFPMLTYTVDPIFDIDDPGDVVAASEWLDSLSSSDKETETNPHGGG